MQPSLRSIACIGALTLLPLAAWSSGGAGRGRRPASRSASTSRCRAPSEGRATPTLNTGVRLLREAAPHARRFSALPVNARDDAINGVHSAKLGADNLTGIGRNQAISVVLGVIGPFDSTVARAAIPVANQAHLAMISPSASDPCLTQPIFVPAGLSPAHKSCRLQRGRPPSARRPTAGQGEQLLPAGHHRRPPGRGRGRLRIQEPAPAQSGGPVRSRGIRPGAGRRLSDSVQQAGRPGRRLLGFRTRGGPRSERVLQPGHEGGELESQVYFGGVAANRSCSIRTQAAAALGSRGALPWRRRHRRGPNLCPRCGRRRPRDVCHGAGGGLRTGAPREGGDRRFPSGLSPTDRLRPLHDAGVRRCSRPVRRDRQSHQSRGAPGRADVLASASTAFAGVTGTFGFDSAGDTTSRIVSIFEAQSSDPQAPWPWVGAVDYSAKLPY